MKPAPFTYHRAASADEAVAILAEHGDAVKVLAGGQSLVPMMNLRLAAPTRLVDITHAADLGGLDRMNGHVEIGAAVRQAEAEDSTLVRDFIPLLHGALDHVAHREIRNAGTVCGSAAHADAAAEIPAVILALDAEIVARSARGTRSVPARDFFHSHFSTALDPDELLIAMRLPATTPGTGAAFVELAPRKGDYALIGVAAQLVLVGDRIERASLGYLGAGQTPVRSAAAEAVLADSEPTEDAFAEAARCAAAELEPRDDIHASANYRRQVAGVLTRRALATALRRARGIDPTEEGL